LQAVSNLRTAAYGAKTSRGRDLRGHLVTVKSYRDPSSGRLKLIDTSKYMRRHHSGRHQYSKWQGAIEIRTAANRMAGGDPLVTGSFPTVYDPNGDNLFTDRAAVSLAENLSLTYDTYRSVFGRNSVNGLGLSVIGNVHLGRKYDNAFWSPRYRMMFFGDNLGDAHDRPFPRASDVVAHEFAHGVTSYAVRGQPGGGFIYEGQSGAIDEGYADVFASVVDWGDWLMGEDLGQPLRSLRDPAAYDQPVSMWDFFSMPVELDNGGVHTDDSLMSYVYYLVVSQLQAGGMPAREARSAAARVYYQAYRYLDGQPSATFQIAGNALLQAANDLQNAGFAGIAVIVQSKLMQVGLLQASVLAYDDGSVSDQNGDTNSWVLNSWNGSFTYRTSYVATRFDKPASGTIATVQVGLFSTVDGPQIPDYFQVWLTPVGPDGEPAGNPTDDWVKIYSGAATAAPAGPATAKLRYDGVFTNFRLPSAGDLPAQFCVVVRYAGASATMPSVLADTGSTDTGRSWVMATGADGSYWFPTNEFFGVPYNWMIRVVWNINGTPVGGG
jgi:hypothetical protein